MTNRRRNRLHGPAGLASLAAAAVFASAAAAEPPTWLPGRHATIGGTQIACTVTSTSVTCWKAHGLTATLFKNGTVRVTHASNPPRTTGRPTELGVNGGFTLANASIYCHIYASAGPIMDCSDQNPYGLGGIPGTHGFDISNSSLSVYLFDATRSIHVTKTYPQA